MSPTTLLTTLLLTSSTLALPSIRQFHLQQPVHHSAPSPSPATSSCECTLSSTTSSASSILFSALSRSTENCISLEGQLNNWRTSDPEYWTALLAFIESSTSSDTPTFATRHIERLPNREDEDESQSLSNGLQVRVSSARESRLTTLAELRAMRIRALTLFGLAPESEAEEHEERIVCRASAPIEAEVDRELAEMMGAGDMDLYDIPFLEEDTFSDGEGWLDEGSFLMACGVVALLLAMVAEMVEGVFFRYRLAAHLTHISPRSWFSHRCRGEEQSVYLAGEEKRLYAAETRCGVVPVVVITDVDGEEDREGEEEEWEDRMI